MNLNYSHSNNNRLEDMTGLQPDSNPVSPMRKGSELFQSAKKDVTMSTMQCSLLSLGCIFGFTASNHPPHLTALHAFKIAQRRLRPEVRAKLLSVSSSRSDSSLMPDKWRFVFHDPLTSGNCRVVTVAAKTSSEHPDTVEAFSTAKNESAATNHPITQNKFLIDSDVVLTKLRNSTKLKGITSAEYRLSQLRSGQEPLWLVSFFAEAVEPVARFQVGAKTGTVKILANE